MTIHPDTADRRTAGAMSSNDLDRDARRAASFLIEALDLRDDLETVGRELSLVDRDRIVTVYAAEFESSVGPAAFLVYLYRLAELDDDGRHGRDRFRDDLKTLETAAKLDAPGPRAVGHVESEDEALILATSPAVWRALRGEPAAEPLKTPDAGELAKTRGDQALDLLRLLREADGTAEAWLAAIDAAGSAELTSEEVELSLFLNDERSIKNLLQALNRLLSTSRPAVS